MDRNPDYEDAYDSGYEDGYGAGMDTAHTRWPRSLAFCLFMVIFATGALFGAVIA